MRLGDRLGEGGRAATAAAGSADGGPRCTASRADGACERHPGGDHHVGNVLPDIAGRHRARIDRYRGRIRRRPANLRRRPRPRCRVRSRASSVRRRENSLVAMPSRGKNPFAPGYTIGPMTSGSLEFTVQRTSNPATAAERESILADPGFGKYFTDHMVSIDYAEGQGWHNARVIPYGPIQLDPSALVLHYAQEVFEGLKAYRWADGSIVSFRAEANAARMRSSARRLAIPELPESLFIESLGELIAVDYDWVPPAGGEESLYLRPFVFATEPGLGVRPAKQYRYLVIASPAGAYFPRGIKPVSVWLSTEYVRAAPGGTGAAKFGGNYAASLLAQAEACANDCDQVVWLDAVERRYVEEMGGMNLFFVFGSGGSARLVTPELTGTLLPGITRDSLLHLATDAGFAVEERKIDVEEWQKKVAAGEITEVFACGTAAVITPVSHVKYADGEFAIADGEPGEVTMALRDTLTGIQRGTFADTHGWMTRLD